MMTDNNSNSLSNLPPMEHAKNSSSALELLSSDSSSRLSISPANISTQLRESSNSFDGHGIIESNRLQHDPGGNSSEMRTIDQPFPQSASPPDRRTAHKKRNVEDTRIGIDSRPGAGRDFQFNPQSSTTSVSNIARNLESSHITNNEDDTLILTPTVKHARGRRQQHPAIMWVKEIRERIIHNHMAIHDMWDPNADKLIEMQQKQQAEEQRLLEDHDSDGDNKAIENSNSDNSRERKLSGTSTENVVIEREEITTNENTNESAPAVIVSETSNQPNVESSVSTSTAPQQVAIPPKHVMKKIDPKRLYHNIRKQSTVVFSLDPNSSNNTRSLIPNRPNILSPTHLSITISKDDNILQSQDDEYVIQSIEGVLRKEEEIDFSNYQKEQSVWYGKYLQGTVTFQMTLYLYCDCYYNATTMASSTQYTIEAVRNSGHAEPFYIFYRKLECLASGRFIPTYHKKLRYSYPHNFTSMDHQAFLQSITPIFNMKDSYYVNTRYTCALMIYDLITMVSNSSTTSTSAHAYASITANNNTSSNSSNSSNYYLTLPHIQHSVIHTLDCLIMDNEFSIQEISTVIYNKLSENYAGLILDKSIILHFIWLRLDYLFEPKYYCVQAFRNLAQFFVNLANFDTKLLLEKLCEGSINLNAWNSKIRMVKEKMLVMKDKNEDTRYVGLLQELVRKLEDCYYEEKFKSQLVMDGNIEKS